MSSANVEWYRSLEASFVAPSNASFSTWPDSRHESSAHRQTSRLLRLALQAGKNVTITLTGGSSSAARESFAYHFGRQMAAALSPGERGGNCTIDASSSTWRCPVAGRLQQFHLQVQEQCQKNIYGFGLQSDQNNLVHRRSPQI